MKRRWFKEWGWVYYPRTWHGWLLVAFAVIFCAKIFIAVDRNSHSVSDTLYGIFPYIIPSLLTLGWIASKTSAPEDD